MGLHEKKAGSAHLVLGFLGISGFVIGLGFSLILSVFLSFIRIDPWFVFTTIAVFLLWQIVPSVIIGRILDKVRGNQEEQKQATGTEPPYLSALLLGMTCAFMFYILKFGAF